MLAVYLDKGEVSLREVEMPVRPPGSALLRLRCAGICNTDLELQRGYYNFSGVPGHEFVADVVEAEGSGLIGKRVVGEINLGCMNCDWCRRGRTRHCPNRTVLGIAGHPGAFQEYFTLPERNLHVVPDSVADDTAVFTEPLAAACEILDQIKPPGGCQIAVLGDGKLGLLVAQVLNASGFRVHQYGRHEEKLRIAASVGVTTRFVGDDVPAARYDWVVEATGSAMGLHMAAQMLRPLGTLVMKSTVHDAVQLDTAPLVVNEITLVGSRCGRFEAALPLLRDERIRLREMISDRFPLAGAPAAFRRAAERGVLKVLLT